MATTAEKDIAQESIADVAATGIAAVQLTEAAQWLLAKAEYHLEKTRCDMKAVAQPAAQGQAKA